MVSILLGVWNGGGVCCCCPAQCSGVVCALLIPLQCWRVLLSCRALLLARCCGVWVVSVCVLFVWWGILCVLPPLHVVGGAVVDGGVHGEGRAAVLLTPPFCARCPPSVCWCPPCHLPCGPVEWREWWVVCCPVFGLGLAPCIVPLPFTLSVPFVSFPFLFCLVLLCLLWVGKCGGGTVPRFPLLLPTVCVLCHGIVGLVLCLCGRVVSLWNGGGGLGWVEGRVASTVYCQLFMCV